jgi:hypothetical protein
MNITGNVSLNSRSTREELNPETSEPEARVLTARVANYLSNVCSVYSLYARK